ncbi:MAG TPA: class I SAM-dependent methyltransferase [Vicinamibacterales bacterium]|nr:class I SAM-dependent methyltransferase [Vicinamibacterales bacterium]
MSDFWEDAARTDPLWAILSDPEKRNRAWDLDEFFETGRREIARVFGDLRALGRSPEGGDALDFGCGVGRLTQALAPSFHHVTGVDISPTMIQLAGRLNRFPDRVRYLVNARSDLVVLPAVSFDFIYSDIALQHIPPDQSRAYIAEFLRVLRPGGIVVFQLTAEHREAGAAGGRVAPMPPDAYDADIAVADGAATLEPGAACRLVVTVTNRSQHAWDPQEYGVLRVGNHWLDASGSTVVRDDGRTGIGALGPGERTAVPLTVRAPMTPQTYICEIDIVQEDVTWFADRGSRTVRMHVSVETSAAGPQTPAAVVRYPDIYDGLAEASREIGRFPMFGIPRADVLALIEAGGGRAIHVEADDRGGAEWIGYRYFVVKTESGARSPCRSTEVADMRRRS